MNLIFTFVKSKQRLPKWSLPNCQLQNCHIYLVIKMSLPNIRPSVCHYVRVTKEPLEEGDGDEDSGPEEDRVDEGEHQHGCR